MSAEIHIKKFPGLGIQSRAAARIVDMAQHRASRQGKLKFALIALAGSSEPAPQGPRKSPKQIERPVPGVPGMSEIVYPSGRKAWRGRYRDCVSKRRPRIKLGDSRTSTFSQAVAAWLAIQTRIAAGQSPRALSPTLSEFFDGAYTEYAQGKKRSFRDDISRFNSGIRPVIGHILMKDLTCADLERCINSLQRTRK
ncbi:MAG: integrase arm-type DNA-binding domain-containing protein [Pseudomonadota bacterium]